MGREHFGEDQIPVGDVMGPVLEKREMEPEQKDWRTGLEAATTLSEYLHALEALPVTTSPEEVQKFLLGDNQDGFLTRLKDMSGQALKDDLEDSVADGIMVFDSIEEYGLEGYTYAALASKLRSGAEADSSESFLDLYTAFFEQFRLKIIGDEIRQLRTWMERSNDPASYAPRLLFLLEKEPQFIEGGEVEALKERVAEESGEEDISVRSQDTPDERWEDDESVYETSRSEELLLANFEDLVDGLGTIGSKEQIPLILKALETMPHGMLNRAAGRALSKIDAPAAAAELLGSIRSRETSSEEKQLYSRVLYLIELGRVGISERGVEYLDKQFDLGEYNNPGFFAHRITAEGDVGIFDEKRVLQKYFHVGDVSADEQLVHATVLDITADRLFLQTGEGSGNEERGQLIAEFKEKYFDVFDDKFFQETGVRFNDLTLREQFWFLQFILHGNAERQTQTLSFVKKYKEPGLRTFLSFEFDSQVGDRVFSIAEHAAESQARGIFKKYEEILQTVEEVRSYVRSAFPENRVSENDIATITKNISLRANGVLVQFADQLEHAEGGDRKELQKDALETLRRIRADVVAFTSVFKVAFKGKGKEKVNFAEVRGLEYQKVLGTELTEAQKTAMEEIFGSNYSSEPEFIARFHQFLHPNSDEGMETLAKNTFTVLSRHDEKTGSVEILSFLRLEKRDDGRLYFAANNVNPEFRGSGIGEHVMIQSVREAAKHHPIDATFPPDSPIGTHYIGAMGFVGTGFKMELGKYPRFAMSVDKDTNEYQAKKMSKEELVHVSIEQQGKNVQELILEPLVVIERDAVDNREQVFQEAEIFFDAGYVMSQYLSLDAACRRRLYVFERGRAAGAADEVEARKAA